MTLKLYEVQILEYISAVLLEESHTYLFINCQWLLLCYNSKGK